MKQKVTRGGHYESCQAQARQSKMKLHCNACVSYGSPSKTAGRLVRRAQLHPAAGRPVQGGIEQRVDHSGNQRRPRAVQDHVLEPLGPIVQGHCPTNPAIAGPVVQHRPAQ